MTIEVYFRDDIACTIAAGLLCTLSAVMAHANPNTAFFEGAVAQAQGQAAAFGLPWADVCDKVRAGLPGPRRYDVDRMLLMEETP